MNFVKNSLNGLQLNQLIHQKNSLCWEFDSYALGAYIFGGVHTKKEENDFFSCCCYYFFLKNRKHLILRVFDRVTKLIFQSYAFSMKLSYCCLVCIFVVVLSDANAENHGDGVNEQQLPHIITLVDQLTANYLKEEDHLWAVIQKREDSTLQQIHDVHQSFLKRQYGESNVIHSNIFMSPNPNVLAHLSVINQTSYEIAHEFFGHPNYSALSIMALNAIDLDKTFELVFEQTANSTEFWSNLKNVSKIRHTVNWLRERWSWSALNSEFTFHVQKSKSNSKNPFH